jgi:HEPN domain-containing protein
LLAPTTDLFVSKAASDLAAARSLAADPEQSDDVVGFHAQQAVEKPLKAVIAIRGLEIPRSHDIELLLRLLDPGDSTLPGELAEAGWLNPWAVTMRYDETIAALERGSAMRVAESCLTWAGECDTDGHATPSRYWPGSSAGSSRSTVWTVPCPGPATGLNVTSSPLHMPTAVHWVTDGHDTELISAPSDPSS